jgi:hypothetical protein
MFLDLNVRKMLPEKTFKSFAAWLKGAVLKSCFLWLGRLSRSVKLKHTAVLQLDLLSTGLSLNGGTNAQPNLSENYLPLIWTVPALSLTWIFAS